MKTYLFSVFLLFPFLSAFSQTVYYAGGNYSGDKTWNYDQVKVTADVTISGSLTIPAGTEVEFQGHYVLKAETIFAYGALSDSIVFTIDDTTGIHDLSTTNGGWNGIACNNGTFKFCVIEYGKVTDPYKGVVGPNGGAGTLEFFDSRLHQNYSNNDRNGVLFYPDMNMKMIRCNISNNQSNVCSTPVRATLNFDYCTIGFNSGHAIVNTKGKTTVTNCYIFRNNGIGVRTFEEGGENIIGNIFDGNTTGVSFTGSRDCKTGLIAYNIFKNHTNKAIAISQHEYVIMNNQIYDNFIGLGLSETGSVLYNNLIIHNTGGGVHITIGSYCGTGGVDLINNTICNNSASYGAAIYSDMGSFNVINCIIRGNASTNGDPFYTKGGAKHNCSIKNSNLQYITSDEILGTFTGNIDADPLFRDEGDGDLRPIISSPCVNAGTSDTTGLHLPETDLDDNPRIVDGRVDMGAYECQDEDIQILLQPISISACAGTNTYIKTLVAGSITGYRWYKNGTSLSSQTQPVLSFNPIAASDSGFYNCLIFSSGKIYSTDTVKVSVIVPVNILSQTSSFTLCPGKDSLLTVTVSGGKPLEYTWYKNLVQVTGNHAPSLHIPQSENPHQDIFKFTIANSCGSLTSENITVSVTARPSAPVVPTAVVCGSESAVTLKATGSHIRWYENPVPVVDSRDAKTYNTVRIGSQHWMARNLNTGQKINSPQMPASNSIIEKYCFNNSEANCDVCGGMYMWSELMNYSVTEKSKGICPAGWHIPSDGEWKELERSLGMTISEIGKADDWRGASQGPMLNAGGSTGFESLKGGLYSDAFKYFDDLSSYWTSTQYDGSTSWNRGVGNENGLYRGLYSKVSGYYIRCVRDAGALVAEGNTFETGLTPSGAVNKFVVTQTISGCESAPVAPSITVENDPVPALEGSYNACRGEQVTLSAGNGFTGYIWNTGATSESISVSESGTYSVTVTTAAGCSGSKSTLVTIHELPEIELGGPYYAVTGQSVTLSATAGMVSYAWSTGAITRVITVTSSGSYSVTVTDNNSCSNTDTAVVTISDIPVVDIGGPFYACEGEAVELDAGSGFTAYLWNTGEISQKIQVTESGTFSVTVTNSLGNKATDETQVAFYPLPDPQLPEDTTMLVTDTLTLDAGIGWQHCLWSTGSEDQIIKVYGLGEGTYLISLRVTDEHGCKGTDVVRINFVEGTYLKDIYGGFTFKIYPVPGKDIIYLKPEKNYEQAVVMKIMDYTGRIVLVKKFENLYESVAYPVDISGFPDGCYYLSISNKEILKAERIIKIAGQ